MSVECSECEHDLRTGHGEGCSRCPRCPTCAKPLVIEDEEIGYLCPQCLRPDVNGASEEPQKKPTIAELEAMIEDGAEPEIKPDGTVIVEHPKVHRLEDVLDAAAPPSDTASLGPTAEEEAAKEYYGWKKVAPSDAAQPALSEDELESIHMAVKWYTDWEVWAEDNPTPEQAERWSRNWSELTTKLGAVRTCFPLCCIEDVNTQ